MKKLEILNTKNQMIKSGNNSEEIILSYFKLAEDVLKNIFDELFYKEVRLEAPWHLRKLNSLLKKKKQVLEKINSMKTKVGVYHQRKIQNEIRKISGFINQLHRDELHAILELRNREVGAHD